MLWLRRLRAGDGHRLRGLRRVTGGHRSPVVHVGLLLVLVLLLLRRIGILVARLRHHALLVPSRVDGRSRHVGDAGMRPMRLRADVRRLRNHAGGHPPSVVSRVGTRTHLRLRRRATRMVRVRVVALEWNAVGDGRRRRRRVVTEDLGERRLLAVELGRHHLRVDRFRAARGRDITLLVLFLVVATVKVRRPLVLVDATVLCLLALVKTQCRGGTQTTVYLRMSSFMSVEEYS